MRSRYIQRWLYNGAIFGGLSGVLLYGSFTIFWEIVLRVNGSVSFTGEYAKTLFFTFGSIAALMLGSLQGSFQALVYGLVSSGIYAIIEESRWKAVKRQISLVFPLVSGIATLYLTDFLEDGAAPLGSTEHIGSVSSFAIGAAILAIFFCYFVTDEMSSWYEAHLGTRSDDPPAD